MVDGDRVVDIGPGPNRHRDSAQFSLFHLLEVLQLVV